MRRSCEESLRESKSRGLGVADGFGAGNVIGRSPAKRSKIPRPHECVWALLLPPRKCDNDVPQVKYDKRLVRPFAKNFEGLSAIRITLS